MVHSKMKKKQKFIMTLKCVINPQFSTSLKAALFFIPSIILLTSLLLTPSSGGAVSEIKIIVNKQAITNTDIRRRTALLQLQGQTKNVSQKAREFLIDDALKLQEMQRLGAVPTKTAIETAYQRLAANNGLSTRQLNDILNEAGVTPKHFKQFIRIQIGWPRIVNARYGNGRKISTQDLVSKMLEHGDDKPTTTEYILQQVIFVVPSAKRNQSTLRNRNVEAKRFRADIGACDTNKQRVQKLKDVTIRNLGRFLKPELPPEWAPLIAKTNENQPTTTRITDKGVEFLVVCKARDVSDDVAAEMIFRSEELNVDIITANEKKYLAELHRRALIADK